MEDFRWRELTNQKQWREQLTRLLKESDAALFKAVLVIYERQTNEERLSQETREENKKGFSSHDAKFLSSIAEQIKRGYPLTEAQKAITRNKMVHYWRQLMEVSKKKIAREDALRAQEEERIRDENELFRQNQQQELQGTSTERSEYCPRKPVLVRKAVRSSHAGLGFDKKFCNRGRVRRHLQKRCAR